MLYRKNQNGGDLSQLGFGCMRFPRKGVGIDIAKSAEMVHSAIEKGVNYFDTAYMYPGSEDALGRILSKEMRGKINIATKMPCFFVRSSSDFDKYFNEQLKRLQTDYIDYYMLHSIFDFNYYDKMRGLGINEWLEKEKERGRIKNTGFSYHGRSDEFIKIIDEYDWNFCMIQYNYLDENYQAGKTGLKYAHGKNIPVIAMEPLRGGTLASKMPDSALREFNNINKERTPAEWALRWLWNQPEVTVVLSGMGSQAQVSENIAAASDAQVGMMTEPELEAIKNVTQIMRSNIRVNCTGCNYCMPCPASVDIPSAFSRYNESAMVGKLEALMQYIMTAGVFAASPQFASQCVKCGKCEKLCPQHINIMRELENAAKYFEPFWVKAAVSLARRFTKIKK